MDAVSGLFDNYYTQYSQSSTKTSELENKLKNQNISEQTDEELMDACKEFEAYFIEQVMQQVKETIPKSEDEEDNKYLDYFGDMMLQECASIITEDGSLGIAQELYESMKNNINALNIRQAEVTEEATVKAQETAGAAQKTEE